MPTHGQIAENNMKVIDFDPFEEPPWLKNARSAVRLSCNQTAVGFINLMLGSCRISRSSEESIESFLHYGKNCAPVEGAICIFENNEHIGFLHKIVDTNDIEIISCNTQKGEVEITKASEHGNIVAFKRPENFAI